MAADNTETEQQAGRPHKVLGILLMMPIGIILAIALFYLVFAGRVGYPPYTFLFIFLIIFLILFVVRMLFWRSRRRYWRQQMKGNKAIQTLRERYVKGEITKAQFRDMARELRRSHKDAEQ